MAHLVRRPVPDHVPSGLVREFDFFTDPNFLADPWVAFDALADAPEIFWSPVGGQGYHGGGGYWFIHGYDAVREGFRRHDLFGASFGPGETSMPEAAECPAGVPLTVDPPDHARYRALLAEDFTPRAAAMLESKLRTLAADLIDSSPLRRSWRYSACPRPSGNDSSSSRPPFCTRGARRQQQLRRRRRSTSSWPT